MSLYHQISKDRPTQQNQNLQNYQGLTHNENQKMQGPLFYGRFLVIPLMKDKISTAHSPLGNAFINFQVIESKSKKLLKSVQTPGMDVQAWNLAFWKNQLLIFFASDSKSRFYALSVTTSRIHEIHRLDLLRDNSSTVVERRKSKPTTPFFSKILPIVRKNKIFTAAFLKQRYADYAQSLLVINFS